MGGDYRDIIGRVCILEEKLLPNSVGSVMLMDWASNTLNVFSAPNVPPEAVSRLNGLRPGPGGGSCGNVIYRRQPQFVSDTSSDDRWCDLRSLAVDFNLCACWSVPIRTTDGNIVGTFALSSFEHRSPSPFHLKILEIGSSIIGIVLERNRSQEALKLYQMVFEGTQEGVLITDANNRILLVNESFVRTFGYERDELTGLSPTVLASGKHDADFYKSMWQSINLFGSWYGEIWNRRKNGEIFPEWLSISAVSDGNGNITHYIGIFTEITDRKDAEERIQYLSSHDVLTGLPTRMLFRDRLDTAITLSGTKGAKVGLLHLNLDNFKFLNDSLGHAAGDQILTQVAARLRQCVRKIDAVCRHGGDEFLIALADMADADAISALVVKVLEEIAQPLSVDGRSLSLTCSIGVAVYPDDSDDVENLLKCADKAMFHAKESGRNTYRFFTEQFNIDSMAYIRIAQGLRDALAQGQFQIHYQPQIDLTTSRVSGVEALIRWNHPTEGLILPGNFIEVAEQTGLIVDMGEWVLGEACRQAMEWRRAGLPPVVMAVNLSGVQFRRGNVEQSVRFALEQSGLPPEFLELELTESVLLNDTDAMLERVNRLKDMGLGLSIDDFGTGYSSLAYLKRFKIDRLKIDRSFVTGIASNPNDAAIVKAIIQMARTLNLKTVAEGVDNSKVLEILRDCLCDAVQGYLLCRPEPAEQIAALLGRHG